MIARYTRPIPFTTAVAESMSAAGMLREQAYRIVQSQAMKAWEEEGDFRAAIEADPEIRALLAPDQLARAFSVDRYLAHVDTIFERVFGKES